jgi:hypothetical protein
MPNDVVATDLAFIRGPRTDRPLFDAAIFQATQGEFSHIVVQYPLPSSVAHNERVLTSFSSTLPLGMATQTRWYPFFGVYVCNANICIGSRRKVVYLT